MVALKLKPIKLGISWGSPPSGKSGSWPARPAGPGEPGRPAGPADRLAGPAGQKSIFLSTSIILFCFLFNKKHIFVDSGNIFVDKTLLNILSTNICFVGKAYFVDKLFNKNVQQQIAGERLVGMVR